MKIVILLLIILFVFVAFRLLQIKSQFSKKKNNDNEEKIIDLEKDTNTDEYKPKE
jgi:predicted RND superfamily exporter protein